MLKGLRYLAIGSFVAGAALLIVGFVRPGGDEKAAVAEESISIRVTPTATLEATPTGTTAATFTTAAPTPTPVPYDGVVTRLKIPRFKVDSAIEAIGFVGGTNQLDTPHDPLNTGWYDLYDKPGFRGNALFSAHVDYWPDIKGPFNRLHELDAYDEIVVVMDDGREYTYRVIFRERYEVTSIPMGELIAAAEKPEGAEWITLITCGGRFVQTSDEGFGEYLDRDVVIAELVAK